MRLLPRVLAASALSLALLPGPAMLGGCATTRTYDTYDTYAAYPATTVGGAADYFWDDLSPYGEWFQLGGYGWVWAPYDTYAGWRPYTYGRWAYSDVGWTWVSYWDWGWAPFHYGRWAYDGRYGWVWVPGTTWGPAWVAWRYGGGAVGWAPLPPSAVYSPRYGVRFGRGGINVAIAPSWWVFTSPGYLSSPRLYSYVYSGARYPYVLRSTRPVVRYEQGRHGVIHRGLDVDSVERQSGRTVPRLRSDDVARSRAMSMERLEQPGRSLGRAPRQDLRAGQSERDVLRRPPPERLSPRAPTSGADDQLRPERPAPPFAERRSPAPERSIRPPERTPSMSPRSTPPPRMTPPPRSQPPSRISPPSRSDRPSRASPPSRVRPPTRSAPPPSAPRGRPPVRE